MRLMRPAVGLSAAVLLLFPLLAHAVDAPETAAPVAAQAGQLPTSWPAVPVAERLQPWLAEELANGGADRLRVMVSGQTIEAATDAAQASGMTIQQTWTSSGIVVALGTPAQVRDVVTQPGVRAVEGDQPITFQLDTAHKATRSDIAESTFKASDGTRVGGAGSSVAIIDSGIDGRHPFFQREGKSTVVRNLKNVCSVLSGPTDVCFQHDPSNDTDTTSVGGHGTHVAGITGGVDTVLPDGTELRGSAPDVNLVGLSVGATLSIINANAAMQWVLEHHKRPCSPAGAAQELGPDPLCPPIKATNHSYGPASVPAGGHKFVENNPTVTIQRNLVAAGVTVVWAAGNSAGDGSIATTNPPAMDPRPGVLMVASYNDAGTGTRDNELSTFSSRGKDGDQQTYPDLSAPGDLITSACRPYLAVCATGFDFRNGPGPADIGTFNTISGTSMATPYVAGVVAQLVQAKPDITPAEVEDLLEDNAYAFGTGYEEDTLNPDSNIGTSFDRGHGLVDVAATLLAVLGGDAPGEPAPVCTPSSFQVVDRAGDATQVVLVDTPLPTQPSLDITKAFMTYDAAAESLTFTIAVTDLTAGPPAGSLGEFFRFYVTRAGDPEVFVTANRRGTAATFSLRQQGGLTTPLTGTFDVPNDEVRVTMPLAAYSTVLAGKTIVDGNSIGVGQVLAQRDTNAATLTADTATGSCPFVVGTSTPGATPTASSPAPSPSPTEAGGGGAEQTASPSPEPGTTSPSPEAGSTSPSPSPTETARKGGRPSPTASPSCSPKGKGGSCR
jgi:serine protease AprX